MLAIAGVARLLSRTPLADLGRKKIVVGRRSIDFDEVDTAMLEVAPDLDGRRIELRFGRSGGLQVTVLLSVGDRIRINAKQRGIVLAILNASRVAMPSSQYDPTGSFARWNFPSNLTKAQAIEVVTNPPGPGDPLPVPQSW
jgi:hypothetical protein